MKVDKQNHTITALRLSDELDNEIEQKYVCEACSGVYKKAQLATYRGTKIHCPACLPGGTVWTMKEVPNAELTSPPPAGFDNKPDYGGGSG